MGDRQIVVVGAGVVGAAVALALVRDGHRVLLFDREGPAAGASFGNAGAIVNGSCAPTAMPGVWKEAFRSIGNPLGPVSIRPAYLPRALPWLIRFMADGRQSRVARIARDLHALSRRAVPSWRDLTAGTELARYLHEGGWLKVYESEPSFAKTAAARRLMDTVCSPYELLSADDIRDLEPHLAPVFEYGIFQKDSLRCPDPAGLVKAMVEHAVANGAEFRKAAVTGLDVDGEGVLVRGPAGPVRAGKVVIAAGAWSGALAAQVGNRVPLDTERGYHMMLPKGSERLLSRPVMNGDRSFVLSPMADGIRMTSQVEIAGLDAPPSYARIRQLLPEARRMLPALDAREASVWMGCRPSLPDSLPVIGASKSTPNVLLAFGHQHLGLTLAAATALAIASLIAGRDPGFDLGPYRPGRY
ncbi:MAG: FAD-dependent oxidoreductase [Woeseia sp.]